MDTAAAGSGITGHWGRAAGRKKKATRRSSYAPPHRRREWTPPERRAALAFLRVAIEDLKVYMAMTEEEVEDAYRRAGKLHKYDPETELQKRYARVAKVYPPPDGFIPEMDEYLKLIEDED